MMRNPSPAQPTEDWRDAVRAAQREDDPKKLQALVTAAENVIFDRLQQLAGKNTIEREEITQGVYALRELQVTKLGFPRWSGEGAYLRPNNMNVRRNT